MGKETEPEAENSLCLSGKRAITLFSKKWASLIAEYAQKKHWDFLAADDDAAVAADASILEEKLTDGWFRHADMTKDLEVGQVSYSTLKVDLDLLVTYRILNQRRSDNHRCEYQINLGVYNSYKSIVIALNDLVKAIK